MKKFFALFLVCALVFTAVGCGKTADADQPAVDKTETQATDNETAEGMKDGVYEGIGAGKDSDIKVNLTVENGAVKSIELIENEDTKGISDAAITEIIDEVVANNSAAVDAVSGATYTSEGLIAAITDAMIKAGATEAQLNAKSDGESETLAPIEETFDVVVIGAGGAGLTSAITAKEAGASVVVIEKMGFVGGNTLLSGGEMNVPNSWVQEHEAVEDSIELYTEDTLKGGDNEGTPELVATMAQNALSAATWLKDDVQVEYQPDYLMQFGGHSVPRAIFPKGGSGYELISKLKAKAEALGIEIITQTKAETLLTDENNRVVGVEAMQKGKQPMVYFADKGVILATGGFGSNIEMRKTHNAEYDERYMSTDQEGTTGDGIVMAEAIGADTMHMSYIQTYPTCSPRTGILSYVADTRFDGAVLINKEGKRFVEELDRRDVISKAILAQSDAYGYLIWDQTITEKSHMENYMKEYEELMANGELYKADTLEELAAYFDIPAEQLKTTVETYNAYAEKGKDEDFNRRGDLIALTQAPFHIQKVAPSVHHTMGGIVIDTDAHVLTADGAIIEGLFAAGEVTGGIHGKNRLGGNAITDLAVFGRIAGENVVK